MPQPEVADLKSESPKMKRERDNRLRAGSILSQQTECFLESLQPPEIVGEVENPVLEVVRRLWCRAFDRVCDCVVLMRLSILEHICEPEPPRLVDLGREADHERLVGVFPAASEAIERRMST